MSTQDDHYWELKRELADTNKRVRRIEKLLKITIKHQQGVGQLELNSAYSLSDWRELEHIILTDI